MTPDPATAKPTIVLVHGGYADSSCWNATIGELQHQGYATVCGSNPLRGIPTDAPYIASLLDSLSGPVVLVAHSMGGTVITNAAAGKANVKALVYIAAFVPDVGETQGELITKFPGSEVEPVSVPTPYTKADGSTGTDLYLSPDGQAAFAADLPADAFRVLQATQRPFDADSFGYPTTAAAWKTIPSWGLVAGRDKAIPPECERWMYSRANARKVVEVPDSSHVAMISHPKVVADLIRDAAEAVS
jgi:pimeloyl-ACP methyl ester carboxylesterase